MSHELPEDLTPEERSAFEAVSRPVTPPVDCEERIVRSLRERQLIRDAQPARQGVVVPLRQRGLRLVPRVALAAAALAGAFFLGAEYGRDSAVTPGTAPQPLDALPGIQAEGEVFKNAEGEMVAAVEAQGVRPDQFMAVVAFGKPPIDRDADEAFAVAPLDGSETVFSLRYP